MEDGDGLLFPSGEDMVPWHYGFPLPIGVFRPEIDDARLKAGAYALEAALPLFWAFSGNRKTWLTPQR